jgi:hypothetical protein
MTAASFWDDPELVVNDDFIKFETVGDTVTGTIIAVRKHTFDDGKVAAQIILDTPDGEKTISAGQVKLKAALAEKRPSVGDLLTVTLTEIEKRSGGKTLKHFDVTVGPVAAPAAPPVAAVAPAAVPGGIDLSALTPEQLAAIAALQAK